MTTAEHEYLTIAEAAALLRVSKATIRRSIDAGRIPVVRIGPRNIRIRRHDLEPGRVPLDDRRDPDWWRKYIMPSPPPRFTEEELMARIEVINEAILADRGGVPLDDSLPYIHAARDERDEYLANL
ncbi:MAG TPA: helix-turn-helix domain-containing protein [Dehalococcoidia bacterium]|nr:helix-turn-helix domain-containing protein [Dehalococcoidia bacterium]